MDRESDASDVNLEKQTEVFIDSSEDEEDYVPQGVIRTSDNLETPGNISPQLFPQNIIDNPPILQPNQIKLENEAEKSLPQGGSTSTEITVRPPAEKRKYNRRELLPPREGRGGARQEASSRAMKHFQQNLNKKKK